MFFFSVSIEAQVHLLLLSPTKLNTLGLLRHLYSNFCFASGGLSTCYLCAVTLSRRRRTQGAAAAPSFVPTRSTKRAAWSFLVVPSANLRVFGFHPVWLAVRHVSQ